MKEEEKSSEREIFIEKVTSKLGNSVKTNEAEEFQAMFPDYGDLFDEEDEAREPFEPEAASPEADEYTPNTFDQYLTAEVLLPRNGEEHKGTVRR
jgi:hypothetical protein